MPPQTTTPSTQKVSKSFWGSMSLIQKVFLFIVIAAFLFIGVFFIFGGINSIWEFAFVAIFAGVLSLLAYIIIWATKTYYTQQYFSPKEDWFTRLCNVAIDTCPANIRGRKLYFQGSINQSAVVGGTIIGCMGIPYLLGEQSYDEKGNPEFIKTENTALRIPKYKSVYYGEEGDTFFIYKTGGLLGGRAHYLRCHRTFHGDLNGDVVIFDINPVPYGKFFTYPYKQYQHDIGRIMAQSQIEVIVATYEHQGDLISQAAEAALMFNPWMRYIEQQKSEVMREG